MVPGIYTVHWKLSICTATRTSSYSTVGLSVYFTCIFSLGLSFVCLFVLFDLFVSPFFCFLGHSQFFGASVINLNDPPRALATSTIMWVRS